MTNNQQRPTMDKMREALEYGHADYCVFKDDKGKTCDCGFSARCALLLMRPEYQGALALYRRRMGGSCGEYEKHDVCINGEHVEEAKLVLQAALTHKEPEYVREAANGWQEMATIPECDDLLWFFRSDVFDGPRAPKADDADYWDFWCYAEPPTLPEAALQSISPEISNPSIVMDLQHSLQLHADENRYLIRRVAELETTLAPFIRVREKDQSKPSERSGEVDSELENALGCFTAAYAEGLNDVLANTPDDARDLLSLHDLVTRRILVAQSHIESALAAMGPARRGLMGEDEAVKVMIKALDGWRMCNSNFSYAAAKIAYRALAALDTQAGEK